MTEETFNPRENVTEGINIQSWLLNVNNQSIKLDLWDFDGQKIYYATHQLFLTRHTLYILVFSIRNYYVAINHLEFLDYWLHMIEIFGDNSPILIVENKNKFDERSVDIDHNQQALISKYINNIKGIFSVSCLTGEGIDDLRDCIKQTGQWEVYGCQIR